jgi:predicted small secreted protein
MARKIILALGIATMSLTAAACNTVRGASEDVESVANEADKAI